MTFIAVRCLHCQSEYIVKRGKTARGTQRYLCQNTRCTKRSFCSTLVTGGACLRSSKRSSI
jgi:transposase-like protein